MEKKDYLIKDSFILFIASSVVNLSNFAFHMYATRSLGPELYGALVALLGMVIIFSMPAMALQMTVVKKTSVLRARGDYGSIEQLFKDTTFWFFALGIAVFILFFAGAGPVSSFFNINDKSLVYILGAIAVVALVLPVVRGILQGLQKFKSLGVNLVLDAFLRLGLLVLFIKIGWGLRGAFSTTFFAGLSAYITGLFMITFLFKYKKSGGRIIEKKEIFTYALPVFLSMLGFSFLSYMDIFMVKHFWTEKMAGLYAVTSIIGKAFLFFPGAVVMVLFPKVSEQYELKKNTFKMLGKSMLLTAGISAIGILFCVFFPKLVLLLLTGGGEFYNVAPVVRVFGIAILPLVLFNVVQNYSLAVHKYWFIYIMYGGIILYAGLLWFIHDGFKEVLIILFCVNVLILIFSVISLFFGKPARLAGEPEEIIGEGNEIP